jgi:hypothetical protein
MSQHQKGPNDHLILGAWNAICDRCGAKFKNFQLRRTWNHLWCCVKCWEPRQPQDFVRGVQDRMTTPWARPPAADDFVEFCTPDGASAVPDYAQPDCCIPDFLHPAAIGPFA